MKSDFERATAQAAVDAVEARWQRNNNRQARTKSLQRLRGIATLLLLAAIVGGAALWYLRKDLGGFDTGDFLSFAKWSDGPNGRGMPDDVARAVESYAARLKAVVESPVRLLGEMPADASPKSAPAGTGYYALSLEAGNGFSLYSLRADGRGKLSVMKCSPFGADIAIPNDVFKRQCRKPYLIATGGVAYLCGSKDLRDADNIKSAVCASAGVSK